MEQIEISTSPIVRDMQNPGMNNQVQTQRETSNHITPPKVMRRFELYRIFIELIVIDYPCPLSGKYNYE